ncbi:hypothetical protein ABZ953_05330 [Streptomyces sp. NPDC046465]|uniref:hypothetical protein n=1 Tax=Streptomyces sp. NPDC046465 TaxID=3155810 RepID=UPI0033E08C9C
MAERLRVDGIELENFVKLLNKSNDSLKGLRKALSAATVSGLGSDDLDRACEEFQDEWKYGTEQIGKQTEDLAKIIGKSKDSYQEVDKALEEAMKKKRSKAKANTQTGSRGGNSAGGENGRVRGTA